MPWQTYEKKPFTGGGNRGLGTLVARGSQSDTGGAELLLGALMIQKGFDVSKRYALLFDSKGPRIGLQVASAGGFLVTAHKNGSGTAKTFSIRMTGFCNRFGLRGRYKIAAARLEKGDIWNLRLEKEN